MRNVIGFLTAMVMCAVSASAQTQTRFNDEHKLMKVVVGVSALAIGAAVAAKSSKTTTTTSAIGSSETSSFSTSQLVTGLVIAGAGGIVLWDGLREHRPTTVIGISGNRRAGAQLFFRRSW
jgi:hypothetical protein